MPSPTVCFTTHPLRVEGASRVSEPAGDCVASGLQVCCSWAGGTKSKVKEEAGGPVANVSEVLGPLRPLRVGNPLWGYQGHTPAVGTSLWPRRWVQRAEVTGA